MQSCSRARYHQCHLCRGPATPEKVCDDWNPHCRGAATSPPKRLCSFDGTRGRLRRVELLQLDSGQPMVREQQKSKAVSGGRGTAGRPAWVVGTTQWNAPRSPQIEVRTQKPSALVTTTTFAPSQPSAECRGGRGKQQHGVGWQPHGGEVRETRGTGRRTSQTPHRSPTRRPPPRSHTPHRSSALPRAAEVHSYLPYHGLPRIELEQPNTPKTTASSAGPTARARCRSCPRTSLPLRHTHQLQESGARRAIPPAFISNPTLPHQYQAQPHRRIALFAKCARA